MQDTRVWTAATASVAGVGLALALLAAPGHGQEPVDPPAADAERVEPADRGSRVERRVERPKARIFGFEASGAGSGLGIGVRDVTDEDVTAGRAPSLAGAVVTVVEEESPAAKAGLREGDVIVAFDEERVRSGRQLSRLVRETPEGREVAVEVMRGGQRQVLGATLEDGAFAFSFDDRAIRDLTASVQDKVERMRLDFEPKLRAFEDFRFALPGWHGRRLGVSVQPLTAQLAEHFGVAGGVLVASVEAGSPAAEAGLKAGDIVTALDGTPVEEAGDLRRALAEGGADATLSVTRDGQSLSLTVTFPEPERWTRRERV